MRPALHATLATALVGALAISPLAHARVLYGTVVDVDPVRTGGREVCEPYSDHYRDDRYYDGRYDDRPRDSNRVAGAVTGAILGGALGNQVGDGDGRRAATVAGAVIGGLAGREIQGRHQDRRYNDGDDRRYDDRYGQRCWIEPGNGRAVAYDVTFRADGRIHTTRLNYAPRVGSCIRVDSGYSGW